MLIISAVILIFGLKLYLQGKNNITIIPASIEKNDVNLRDTVIFEEEYLVFHIAGAVHKPGVYQLPKGNRIIDAVKAAGDAAENANLDAINLAAPIYDGQKIVIPYLIAANDLENKAGIGTDLNLLQQYYPQNNNLLNINLSTAKELESLDGIGPVLAERIVEYRKNNGQFKTKEEIKNVAGIGEKKYETIKELITVY